MRIRQAVYLTEQGAQRRSNQDGVLSLNKVPLYAVADGAGGSDAARLALLTLKDHGANLSARIEAVASNPSTTTRLAVRHFFQGAFTHANAALREANEGRTSPLSTTLVAATVVGPYAFLAHVGDSRAYLRRDGTLRCVTADHTLAALQLSRGDITAEDYVDSPFRSTLSRALGMGPSVDVDVAEIHIGPGDVLLLCTNGLHRFADDGEIREAIAHDDLEGSAQRLIDAVRQRGAPDNVTVMLIAVDAAEREDVTSGQVERALREVFLFRDLSDPEWLQVAPYLEQVDARQGEVIVEADGEADAFYAVASGAVEIVQGSERREVGESGYFGTVALASASRQLDTVRALEPTRLFALSRARFEQLVRDQPALGTRLALTALDTLGNRLAVLTTRLAKVIEAAHGEHRY
ncbi:MAG: cyclic nucleotide-binding domain-containing protein [Deltaproteobacteria bacterium]|nr:MAG: cyclic nucleotide-binding domain-containing protein [Deltaproteobacteria bacterium]